MFSEKDKSLINQEYFKINVLSDAVAELESENGDWWILMEVQSANVKQNLTSGG